MSILISKLVAEAYAISENDVCQCGVFKNVVHCPDCSSTQCYGVRRAAPSVLLPGIPRPVEVRAFRCKLCTNTFAESDCASMCKAQSRSRRQAESKTTGVKVNPDLIGKSDAEKMAWVKEQLNKTKRSS